MARLIAGYWGHSPVTQNTQENSLRLKVKTTVKTLSGFLLRLVLLSFLKAGELFTMKHFDRILVRIFDGRSKLESRSWKGMFWWSVKKVFMKRNSLTEVNSFVLIYTQVLERMPLQNKVNTELLNR